jgi:hypothetical protein
VSAVDDGLMASAIALHGPVDMTLTSMFWPREANPLVEYMGLEPWLGFKTALLAALLAVYLWWVRPRVAEDGPDRRVTVPLLAFTALGAGVMLLNLAAVYNPP